MCVCKINVYQHVINKLKETQILVKFFINTVTDNIGPHGQYNTVSLQYTN